MYLRRGDRRTLNFEMHAPPVAMPPESTLLNGTCIIHVALVTRERGGDLPPPVVCAWTHAPVLHSCSVTTCNYISCTWE